MKRSAQHKRLLLPGKGFQHPAGSLRHPAVVMILCTEHRGPAERRFLSPFQMLHLTDSHIVRNSFLLQVLIIIPLRIPGIKAPYFLISFLRQMPLTNVSGLISSPFQITGISLPVQYLTVKHTVKIPHISQLAVHMWIYPCQDTGPCRRAECICRIGTGKIRPSLRQPVNCRCSAYRRPIAGQCIIPQLICE